MGVVLVTVCARVVLRLLVRILSARYLRQLLPRVLPFLGFWRLRMDHVSFFFMIFLVFGVLVFLVKWDGSLVKGEKGKMCACKQAKEHATL